NASFSMIILDENIPASQRGILLSKGWNVRQIGVDLATKGISDEELIRLLLTVSQPTLVTLDEDFDKRQLCHERYCIIYLDIEDTAVARNVIRVLKLPEFKTKSKRMGKLIRVEPTALRVIGLRGMSKIIPWT